MKLQDLPQQINYYVIVNKNTKELLFEDHLFSSITAAKNAFYQRFKKRRFNNSPYYNKKFNDQTDYLIVKLVYVEFVEEGFKGAVKTPPPMPIPPPIRVIPNYSPKKE